VTPDSGGSGTLEVTENEAQERYEITVDGELAGLVTYRRRPGRIAFLHTEVDDHFGGRGVGSTLARSVLDTARADGLQVMPLCPFISSWISKHPEYTDLVPEESREQFDL